MPDLTYVNTGKPEFDSFYPRIQSFLKQDYMDIVIDAQNIRGYRSPDARSIWIRDHSDIMRGFKYYETDVKSTVEHFADTQARNGRIFDYFTVFPEKLPCERENWTKYVRVPVEADVEYRFVKAAFLAWQVTGDDHWIRQLLPNLEEAMSYILTHPWRWDETHQLVKRPYTIDSWDFAYTAGTHDWLQFQIDENTIWGIMHGDNSGYYQAFKQLALLYSHFNQDDKAGIWNDRAETLKRNMNAVCWNGEFYTHFVKLNPADIPGVDESRQLSFSNPININRNVTTHDMAVSILRQYLQRRQETQAFAEWFSIDPAFPEGIFGDDLLKTGAYCNGGIMPMVGGELARAYFHHGFEAEGVATLKRYYDLMSANNETYLWYFPDGTASSEETSTSPDATPTDGWGASSMLYGFIEGLVGIEDRYKLFEKSRIMPRWLSAGIDHADVRTGYEASGRSIGYEYSYSDKGISLELECEKTEAQVHLMIPADATVKNVRIQDKHVDFTESTLEKSQYVDFDLKVTQGARIQIDFK